MKASQRHLKKHTRLDVHEQQLQAQVQCLPEWMQTCVHRAITRLAYWGLPYHQWAHLVHGFGIGVRHQRFFAVPLQSVKSNKNAQCVLLSWMCHDQVYEQQGVVKVPLEPALSVLKMQQVWAHWVRQLAMPDAWYVRALGQCIGHWSSALKPLSNESKSALYMLADAMEHWQEQKVKGNVVSAHALQKKVLLLAACVWCIERTAHLETQNGWSTCAPLQQVQGICKRVVKKHGVKQLDVGQDPLVQACLFWTLSALVHDMDMAILAEHAKEYQKYERAIRCEWAHVPQSAYVLGRQKVLRYFLQQCQLGKQVDAKVGLFYGPSARRSNRKARANIQWALKNLTQ